MITVTVLSLRLGGKKTRTIHASQTPVEQLTVAHIFVRQCLKIILQNNIIIVLKLVTANGRHL
jgi:hypothetical protein